MHRLSWLALVALFAGCYRSHELGADAATADAACDPIPAIAHVHATVLSADPPGCVRVGFEYERTIERPLPSESGRTCTGAITLSESGCAEQLAYTCEGVEYHEEIDGTLARGGSTIEMSTIVGLIAAHCDRTERWVLRE